MKKFQTIILFSILLLFAGFAEAQGISGAISSAKSNIGTVFANGTLTFEALIGLIRKTCYILGMFLVLGAIYKFSQMGDPQKGITVKGPLTMFLVGVVFFAFIPSLAMVANTMSMGGGAGEILSPGVSTNSSVTAAMTGVLTFIKLLGYIAFIRGWLMFNKAANAGGQGGDGLFFRGATHIVGGIAAINITFTAKMLAATFAPGLPLTVLGL